jgi:hypothetical protein
MAVLQSDGVNHTSDLILRRNGTEGLRLTSSTVQLSSINDGSIAGNRNVIINGKFEIAQRGTSISSGIGQLTYTLDRWIVAASTAAVTANQGSQTSEPYNYLSVTGAAGNTAVSIRQRIEANNIRHLAGKEVTLSFFIYNATSNVSTIDVVMDRANAVNDFTTATQFSTTALGSLSDTNRRSITVTLPAEARNGIEVRFVTSALTSGIFVLHTVQLEPGTVATPFERRSFGQELALCQRYYEILSPTSVMLPWNSGTQIIRVSSAFSVTKRAPPAITMGTKLGGTGTMGVADANQYGVTYFGSGSFQDVIIYSGNTASIEL